VKMKPYKPNTERYTLLEKALESSSPSRAHSTHTHTHTNNNVQGPKREVIVVKLSIQYAKTEYFEKENSENIPWCSSRFFFSLVFLKDFLKSINIYKCSNKSLASYLCNMSIQILSNIQHNNGC